MALPVCVCGHVHEMVLSQERYAVGPADACGAVLDPDTKRQCQCQAYCPSGPIVSGNATPTYVASREAAHQRAFDGFIESLAHEADPEC